ncbi:hypothetical protein ACH46L_24115 [Streptomyces althioticus]|uniref:hypothetical protein n=1 Tax=Streptomyces althioticus TaxID=83380 RepID=UPI00379E9B88
MAVLLRSAVHWPVRCRRLAVLLGSAVHWHARFRRVAVLLRSAVRRPVRCRRLAVLLRPTVPGPPSPRPAWTEHGAVGLRGTSRPQVPDAARVSPQRAGRPHPETGGERAGGLCQNPPVLSFATIIGSRRAGPQ